MAPLDPPLKVMALRPKLIGICVYLMNSKDDVSTEYFQKVYSNSSLHRRIISQILTKRFGVGFPRNKTFRFREPLKIHDL